MDNSFIILKYNGFSDRALCTKLHKIEQKDRTKSLAEFPDHILNDYVETNEELTDLDDGLDEILSQSLDKCCSWGKEIMLAIEQQVIIGVIQAE